MVRFKWGRINGNIPHIKRINNIPDYGCYRNRLERFSGTLPPILNKAQEKDLDRS